MKAISISICSGVMNKASSCRLAKSRLLLLLSAIVARAKTSTSAEAPPRGAVGTRVNNGGVGRLTRESLAASRGASCRTSLSERPRSRLRVGQKETTGNPKCRTKSAAYAQRITIAAFPARNARYGINFALSVNAPMMSPDVIRTTIGVRCRFCRAVREFHKEALRILVDPFGFR